MAHLRGRPTRYEKVGLSGNPPYNTNPVKRHPSNQKRKILKYRAFIAVMKEILLLYPSVGDTPAH
jgi:hypothetical protein